VVFEINLIALEPVQEEALVDLYHAALGKALYWEIFSFVAYYIKIFSNQSS
jgi:hypothetical protein